MSDKYNLVFEGNILPEFDEIQARQRICQLLKIPEAQQAAFFSGKEITLKKDLTLDEGLRFKMQLEGLGMSVLLVSASFASLSLAVDEPAIKHNASDKHVASSSLEQVNSQQSQGDALHNKRRKVYREIYDNQMQGEADKDTSDPYQPPSPFALSFEGRYGRLSYLNASIIWMLGFLLIVAVLSFFMKASGGNGDLEKSGFMNAVLSMIYFFCTYRIAVLRAHDLNLSGWFCLLLFVPLAGFIFAVCLLFMRGTDGDNHYGREPYQGSINVIILVVVLLLAFYIISIR